MTDEEYMQEAIKEAKKAASIDEVPVGCIIVKDGKIIARAHNMKEHHQNVIAHAEMLAIKQASLELHNWHLDGCDMYVTLEPCMMCSGAIYQSRIRRVIIGTRDTRWPGLINYMRDYELNYIPRIEISKLSAICQSLLKSYFHEKR